MQCKELQTKRIFFLCVLLTLFLVPVSAQKWKLIQTVYPTIDDVVAGFSVADYGATGDGTTDVTSIFQDRLNALKNLGGGVLFVPQGKYVIKGTLIIPKGITLRGEWQKPIKGQPIVGTILMAYSGRGKENDAPFITMEPAAAVMDLAIWYPEQLPGNITQYPPSIMFGEPGYWGNEFCNAKNITLVNAYSGIVYSRVTGGSCPVINGIYGTPLSRGVEIDNIADVGRIEWIDFSPAYWSGSGLPNAPAVEGPHSDWIYHHGSGIVMRRNDWSYTCFVNIEGYGRGLHVAPSIASPGAIPNGHNYSMTFTKCDTAIYFEIVPSDGIMYARINTVNCTNGIVIGRLTSGVIQMHTCAIEANTNAISTTLTSSVKLMMQQSTISAGQVNILGGAFTASDCDFNNSAPQIILGSNSRGIITGDRFKNKAQIQNSSSYVCAIDSTPVTVKALPSFPTITAEMHKPPRLELYIVTDTPFNAKNDGVTDNSSAIQQALNKAAEDGGGIVFLPPGKYKVLKNLTIPTGVELKGSVDNGTMPMGPGSILEVYAGKDSASGNPFMKLSEGSGIRGVVFDYPEQLAEKLPDIAVYPYCIQVTGSDAYIINVGLRATYSGIDLFTYKCDNHYIDFVAGHVFKNGVVVGGNSTGGKIYNLQFNASAYASGAESKWGSWTNSPPTTSSNGPVYDYGWANLDFLVLDTCTNETLYNNFHYCSHRGTVISGASGICLGLGVDGSRKAMSFESIGPDGLDFINSQIVTVGNTAGSDYLETSSGFTSQSTLFNSDYWGQPQYGVNIAGGNLNLQLANFHNPGETGFATVSAGSLDIYNSSIWPTGKLLNSGAEPRLSAQSSIIDPTGITKESCALWKNNLSNSPIRVTVAVTGITLSPTSVSLTVGSKRQLADNIQPTNATNKIAFWQTSNEAVATVSAEGLVTAIGVGSATITVKTQDGNKTATCAVTVTETASVDNTRLNPNLDIFPNPASSSTLLTYKLSRASSLNVSIFDLRGTLVKSLRKYSNAGNQKFEIDLNNLKSGFYTIMVESSDFVKTKELIIK